ncbi:histidine kinase [Solibacillus sp. R5-41]|uniref:sensor histidine kinase n=1 Tax=Solibacillus sp. R5-41 TaxID=2048654 RepID=UPI000C126A58|nr:HAMP domain-containing sensor histidine kinase [Solibacillus sp. R5-41]ATP39900.1 histidine kinase [Solibacillus sp. R5-41]
MKLFLQDHLSIIALYLFTFICLPFVIQQLDGLENHYSYFVFLSSFLLVALLSVRYLRRKKMYTHIVKENLQIENIVIYHPIAPIEKAYASQLQSIQTILLTQEEGFKQFSQEQQIMISHAVHQMKTPLSVIQLLIQSNNQWQEESTLIGWQKVKTQCNKLDFSLNQLLTYSRSTNLLSDLKIEYIQLKRVIKEVINDLKEYFIEEEVYPKCTMSEDVLLFSDRKWLKVVIYQLLSNAVKYGERNSTVRIDFEKGQLWIKNNGDTIPENEIRRVFDLYFTGSKGRMKGEATGIGLYLVKRILTTLDHPFQLHSANNETIITIDFSKSMKRPI